VTTIKPSRRPGAGQEQRVIRLDELGALRLALQRLGLAELEHDHRRADLCELVGERRKVRLARLGGSRVALPRRGPAEAQRVVGIGQREQRLQLAGLPAPPRIRAPRKATTSLV
jgi:hypothetical protein